MPPPRSHSSAQNTARRLARTLTYILRHGALKKGLHLDSGGFVKASDLYVLDDLDGLNEESLRLIVDLDTKRRFELNEGPPLKIRATQGHSIKQIKSEDLLTQITSQNRPAFAVHGTTTANYALIKRCGYLDRMTRNHIHFATKLPGEDGLISGMRTTSSVFVYLDIDKCLEDGVPVFISSNGVILTPGVGDTGQLPEKYFSRVTVKK